MHAPISARAPLRGRALISLLLALVALFALPFASASYAQAADEPAGHVVADAGFLVTDEAIWTYFDQHGAADTFGLPISREFLLRGAPVQLFERAALQVQPDGSVQPLSLASEGLLPYTHLNGLTLPAPDKALALVTPSNSQ